jgi:hypothetical protein
LDDLVTRGVAVGSFDPLGYFTTLSFGSKDDVRDAVEQAFSSERASATSLGTIVHESAHFLQVAGTPFGMFMSRSLMAQGMGVQLMLSQVSSSRAPPVRPSVRMPLLDAVEGLEGRLRENAQGALEIWLKLEVMRTALLGETSEPLTSVVARSSEALACCFDIGYVDRMHGQFASAKELGMPEVVTNLHDSLCPYPVVHGESVTTMNLLEAHARLLERTCLAMHGTEDDLARLDRQGEVSRDSVVLKLMGMHHEESSFEYSEPLLLSVQALLELALYVPLDRSLHDLWSSCFLWEDISPAYRYVRAAELTKDVGLLTDVSEYDDFQDAICRAAGWLRPREIVTRLLDRLSGSPSPYDRVSAVCLRVRCEDPSYFMFGCYSHPELVAPLVLFPNQFDRVKDAIVTEGETQKLLFHYLMHEYARQILFEDRIVNPAPARLLGIDPETFVGNCFGITPLGGTS